MLRQLQMDGKQGFHHHVLPISSLRTTTPSDAHRVGLFPLRAVLQFQVKHILCSSGL
jgi:hypothetical protein